ncbi:hypothetical protein ACTJKC_03845 [Pedobacter sp. 22226]|uniref:hypothetical protein n=1 Tax=Pedobacter sp. 22226 TaxID=3453894 RepID=UPI003F84986C
MNNQPETSFAQTKKLHIIWVKRKGSFHLLMRQVQGVTFNLSELTLSANIDSSDGTWLLTAMKVSNQPARDFLNIKSLARLKCELTTQKGQLPQV